MAEPTDKHMPYALFALLALAVFAFGCMCYACTARFNKRFPPIDDDEFIRRCRPGVNRDVALRVRRIVSEQLGIDYYQVYPEQRFVDDLSC